MASPLVRWLLVAVLVACVVGLIVWARGQEHHRGEFVGALGVPATASQSLGE